MVAGLKSGTGAFVVATLLMLFPLSPAVASVALTEHCDLPSGFTISGAEGLSRDQDVFLGTFSGKWGQTLDHLLIVERIDPGGQASGYYAWGSYPGWDIHEPGCTRWQGRVSDGRLHFSFPETNENVSYRFVRDNSLREHALEGSYRGDGTVTPGYFVRVGATPPALAHGPPSTRPAGGTLTAEAGLGTQVENQNVTQLEAAVDRMGRKKYRHSTIASSCAWGAGTLHRLSMLGPECREYFALKAKLSEARAAMLIALSGGEGPAARDRSAPLAGKSARAEDDTDAEPPATSSERQEIDRLRSRLAELETARQSAESEKATAEERLLEQSRAAGEAEDKARKAEAQARRQETALKADLAQQEEARQRALLDRMARDEARRQGEMAELHQQLEELQRQRVETDTALPLILISAPGRVEVGERVRVAGLVGDDGSPPRLKVNGQPAPLFRTDEGQKPLARHTLAFAIDIEAEEVGLREFLIEACDAADNCVAERLAVNITAADRPNVEARNHALIIGNNAYRNLSNLNTAVADATAVAEMLTRRYAFEPAHVTLQINATRAEILEQLDAIRRRVRLDDRVLLYYAGHGEIDPITEEGYWQPTDALPGKRYTWIANDDIRRELRGIPAKHILVLADSCFSGSLTRGSGQRGEISKERFYTEIDRPVSRKVISSGGTEPVADSGTGGHSVFAYYLLKALRENDKPYFASFELFNKLVRAVTNNSAQKPQYGTVSEAGDEGSGDFTFILKRGG